MKKYFYTLIFSLIIFTNAAANAAIDKQTQVEIDALLTMVADSGCVFNRNGKKHNAADAKAHLELKLRRGSKYVSSTETFIENLASKSSWTGKNYSMECPNQPNQASGSWLLERLHTLRQR